MVMGRHWYISREQPNLNRKSLDRRQSWRRHLVCMYSHVNILVGGNWSMIFMFPYLGNFIIPTDGLIFFRGVETTNHQPSIDSHIHSGLPEAHVHIIYPHQWSAPCHRVRKFGWCKPPRNGLQTARRRRRPKMRRLRWIEMVISIGKRMTSHDKPWIFPELVFQSDPNTGCLLGDILATVFAHVPDRSTSNQDG